MFIAQARVRVQLHSPAHPLQTLREIASNAQAAAAAASMEARQESEARQQLAQQLEMKTSQITSLLAEGARGSGCARQTNHQQCVCCRQSAGRPNWHKSRGIESKQDQVCGAGGLVRLV
jgi:hypothetical protein